MPKSGGVTSPPAPPGTTGLLSKLHILQFTKSPMILSVTLHAYTCQKASKINNYLDKMTVCTLIFVHIIYVLTTFSYVCTIGSESLWSCILIADDRRIKHSNTLHSICISKSTRNLNFRFGIQYERKMGSKTLLDKLTRYRIRNLHVCGPISKYQVVVLLVNVHTFKQICF